MGDSTSQDLELLMPEKSEEIIIKPETIEKFQTTEERSRLNFYFRGIESKIFSRLQNRSASVFSSEPSFSEMTEMQDFSELTPIRNLVSLMPENSKVSKEINPFQCKSCKNMQEIEIVEDFHEVSEIKEDTNDFSNIAQRWQKEISDGAEYGNTGC